MQCTCSREEILEPLTRAEKATGKNHTLPILSCVLLSVEESVLTITATNLEVGVRYVVPVKNPLEGFVTVQGTTLLQTINTLPVGSLVTISTQEKHLVVKGVTGESKLALQDASEFPKLPTVDAAQTFTLPAHALLKSIEHVSYCASGSIIKPELSSVYIHPDGGTLIAAATDSFRLAEKRTPLEQPVSVDPFLIPARSTQDLIKILETTNGDVTVLVNEHQLSITTQNAYITLRLTAGVFPDYTQIIPKKFITEVTLLRSDFERTLRRAAVFADQFNQTTITINPKKKQFIIHTQHTTIGETTDTVSATLAGEELTISFNQRYLIDALHSIATDSITLQFAGNSQPALVRPVGDITFLYLVMPMNR